MTQEETLDILKLGYNVFLTGPPGSGKTFLLNKYIIYEILLCKTFKIKNKNGNLDGSRSDPYTQNR